MARPTTRTPEEIKRLLIGYEQSGLSRRQYCEQQGIAVTTFDYYRHRQLKRQASPPLSSPLVRVQVGNTIATENPEPRSFTVVLANSRRIESTWSYSEQDLARLIRIVEAA